MPRPRGWCQYIHQFTAVFRSFRKFLICYILKNGGWGNIETFLRSNLTASGVKLSLYSVVDFHFWKFSSVNPLRYPSGSFMVCLGHAIQKYEENLLRLTYWGCQPGLMGHLFWRWICALKVQNAPPPPPDFRKFSWRFWKVATTWPCSIYCWDW